MEKSKIIQLEKKDLKKWVGRPVWYQSLTDINDFGWAFIHPETVKTQPGGFPLLGYCKLIKSDPAKKDWYSWESVRLYNKAKFRGICAHCAHFHKGTLTHCFLVEEGKDPGCTIEKKYRSFEASPYWQLRGYTVKTFLRQLELSGYTVKKKEAANAA